MTLFQRHPVEAPLSDVSFSGTGPAHQGPGQKLHGHVNPDAATGFDMSPEISLLPRVLVGTLNTSITPMEKLSEALGIELLVKRDDHTSLGPAGGNKVRKIQYALGHALSCGADTIITAGGIQSNHCVQTADACNQLGVECHVISSNPIPDDLVGNAFFTKEHYGATLHGQTPENENLSREERMEKLKAKLIEQGKKPYIIPVGASNGIGSTGFALAMFELQEQLRATRREVDTIILATSSGGTQAGMLVGKQMANFPGRIIGVSVDNPEDGAFERTLLDIATECATYIGDSRVNLDQLQRDIHVHYGALGPYAVLREEEVGTISFVTHHGGPLLDPVYTVRGFRGLQQLVDDGTIAPGERVLFWHTGGNGSWEAYRSRYREILDSVADDAVKSITQT
ncbi:MAG: pyridoxal-phosphate dependent enzyme [Bdellovibrionales bacterium]|nr:pyridoxal-phosphate dependent enzyme [Bdellovibrionales bacterium]